MERLSGRIKVIHLRDGLLDGTERALGEGDAPVLAVREKTLSMGLRLVVEGAGCNPTGLEEVKRCIDFLRAQECELPSDTI